MGYPEPRPRPRRPQVAPSRPGTDESAEALGEVGDTAADGTMRVPAYVPVIGEVFAVMTYLLASMGTLPLTSTHKGTSQRRCRSTRGIP